MTEREYTKGEKERKQGGIVFKVDFESPPEKPVEAVAYLFDAQEQLLASAPLKGGQVELPVAETALRGARLFIGPPLPPERQQEKPTPQLLRHWQAYEPTWRFERDKRVYELKPIPDILWPWWPWCKCRVRGRVVKRSTTGGVTTEAPVCNARVHICEVDRLPWIIWRLPDDLIWRLRDELIGALTRPPRVAGPVPDPWQQLVSDPLVQEWMRPSKVAGPQPEPWRQLLTGGMLEVELIQPSPFEPNPDPWMPRQTDKSRLVQAVGRLRNILAAGQLVSRIGAEAVELNPQPEPPSPVSSALRLALAEEVMLNPQPLPPRWTVSAGQLAAGLGSEVMLNPQPLPPKESTVSRYTAGLGSEVMLNPQPLPPKEALASLSLATRTALTSNALPVVRQALLDNVALIRPWLCWWPWIWPYFYRCDELTTVITDEQGRFDTTIWYPCFGDKPDLYFWVEYAIGGVWETVYRPWVHCNTYWDYVCGTEVTIRITDPRVPGCGDRPTVFGKKVVVKAIGRQVSMGEIYREPSVLDPLADVTKAGTVKEGWLHSTKESPFGGILEPRVDWGNGLKPAGITHYRWSYRLLGSTNEADWKVIDAPVSRHYRETTPPGAPVVYKSVQIAPSAGIAGYYAEIEPDLPPGADDWVILDEGYDLATAYWDTRALAPNKYELKLELFRKVGAVMQRVDLTTEAVELYQITDPAPFTAGTYTTTPATHDRALTDTGTGHLVGFRLVLHADNRICFGTINAVTVFPGNNDTKCGFLEYAPSSNATISFRASHPANYAYFDFDVVRVATPLPTASATGLVGAVVVNGFARAGDTFSKDVPVGTLFSEGLPPGETPCVRAAFGEALHVYALATDGYYRLSYLDAPRPEDPNQVSLRAFALTRLGAA